MYYNQELGLCIEFGPVRVDSVRRGPPWIKSPLRRFTPSWTFTRVACDCLLPFVHPLLSQVYSGSHTRSHAYALRPVEVGFLTLVFFLIFWEHSETSSLASNRVAWSPPPAPPEVQHFAPLGLDAVHPGGHGGAKGATVETTRHTLI